MNKVNKEKPTEDAKDEVQKGELIKILKKYGVIINLPPGAPSVNEETGDWY